MAVLDIKSSARNPTRLSTGAICTMWSVRSPVAPHRLWLPSRSETSTSWTSAIFIPNGPGLEPQPPCEELRADAPGGELAVGGQRRVHRHGGRHPADLAPGQRAAQPVQRLGPAVPPQYASLLATLLV